MTTLAPRPGFNWMQVSWGAPDQCRTDRCSYCGAKFPNADDSDFVPLILSRADSWVAEFCEACQKKWWGLRSFREPPDGDDA